MAYRHATLWDTMQTTAQGAASFADAIQPAIKQKADASLRAEQADLENWMNDMARDMESRTDYENFENDYEQKYKDKVAQYQGSYISGYGREQSQQLLDSSWQKVREAAKQRAFDGAREYATTTDLNTLNELGKQAAGQERLDQQKALIDTMAADGRISASQKASLYQQYTDRTYEEMYTNEYNAVFSAHPYASDAELQKYMDKVDIQLDSKYVDANGNEVNFSSNSQELRDSARKSAWTTLNNQRTLYDKDVQSQNYKIINDVLDGKVTTDQGIVNVQNQINAIERTPTSKLSQEDKTQRTNELRGYLNQLTQMRNASTPSARSGTQKAFSYNTITRNMETLRDELLKNVTNPAHVDGTTVWSQKKVYDSKFNTEWAKVEPQAMDYYRSQGMTDQEAREQIAYDKAQYLLPIADEWAQYAEKKGVIPAGTSAAISTACSDIASTCRKLGIDDMSSDLKNYIYESIFATDYNQFGGNSKEAARYINDLASKYKDQVCAKKIDNTIYSAGSKKYEKYNPEEASEKELLGFVRATADNVHYTVGNNSSDVHFAGSSAEALYGSEGSHEIDGKGADAMAGDLLNVMYNGGKASGKKTSLTASSITRSFEPTADGSDITGNIIFTVNGTGNSDYDGYSFRYTESDGKVVLEKKKDGERNWKTVSRGKAEENRKQAQSSGAEAKKAAKAKVDGMETPQTPADKDYMRPEGMDDQTWQRISAGSNPWEINQKVEAWKKSNGGNK